METFIGMEALHGKTVKDCPSVTLRHSDGKTELLVTETEDGFKIQEVGTKCRSLSVKPMFSNAIIVKAE